MWINFIFFSVGMMMLFVLISMVPNIKYNFESQIMDATVYSSHSVLWDCSNTQPCRTWRTLVHLVNKSDICTVRFGNYYAKDTKTQVILHSPSYECFEDVNSFILMRMNYTFFIIQYSLHLLVFLYYAYAHNAWNSD